MLTVELEKTKDDEYLECKVNISGNNHIFIKHWNKNESYITDIGKQYYYKQQHFHSYTTNHSKRGALIGTWTRMLNNTNDHERLHHSIVEKIQELQTLQYPLKYVNNILKYMTKKTKLDVWLQHAPYC